MLSEDAMGLRPATLHENGLRGVIAVFSTGASPIFTAAKHLLVFVESKRQIPRLLHHTVRASLVMTWSGISQQPARV